MESGVIVEVLAHGEIEVDHRLLEHDAHAGESRGRLSGEVVPEDAHGARVGDEQAREDLEQGRLSGPVQSQKGRHPAGLDHEDVLAALDELAPPEGSSFAVRLDGRFASVRARSVPRQDLPYRSLSEVVADQHVFELTDVEGTMVGFRFPAFVEGIEVAGYHLHFVDSARRRGGHVFGSHTAGPLRVRIDPADDLHIELPPAVDLTDPDLAAETHAAIDAAERG